MVSVNAHDVAAVKGLLERVVGRYAKNSDDAPYISALYRQTINRTFSGATKRDDIKEETTNQSAVLFFYKARDRKPCYKIAYELNERCLVQSLDRLIKSAQHAKTTDYHLTPRPAFTATVDLDYDSYPLRAKEYHPVVRDVLSSVVTKRTRGKLDLGLQLDQEVFVDSEGTHLVQRIPRFCLTLDYTVYSARDQFKLRRRVGGAGNISHLHRIAYQLQEASCENAETALKFLHAPDHYGTFHLRSGRYPVILGGEVTGVALEEFFARFPNFQSEDWLQRTFSEIRTQKGDFGYFIRRSEELIFCNLVSMRTNQQAKKIMKLVSTTCERQFSKRRPALLWLHLQGLAPGQIDSNPEWASAFFQMLARHAFTNNRRDHLASLVFTSDADLAVC